MNAQNILNLEMSPLMPAGTVTKFQEDGKSIGGSQ